MTRARCRWGFRGLLAAAMLACGAAQDDTVYAAQAKAEAVDISVIMVTASGSGGRAEFDPRIPATLRQQLARLPLSYNRYGFLGAPRQTTPMGAACLFPLPDSESLSICPSVPTPGARVVRLDTRILDPARRPILTSQMRIGYGAIFLLHRPKGPSGLLLGVSAFAVER